MDAAMDFFCGKESVAEYNQVRGASITKSPCRKQRLGVDGCNERPSQGIPVDPLGSWKVDSHRILRAQINFMRVYSDQLRNIIKMGIFHPEHYDLPLKGLKIVVDAGNGSGGFFAEEVLEPLGADITGTSQWPFPSCPLSFRCLFFPHRQPVSRAGWHVPQPHSKP